MKKVFLQLALFAVSLAIVSSASAQSGASLRGPSPNLGTLRFPNESGSVAFKQAAQHNYQNLNAFHPSPLSPMISLPGTTLLPVTGTFPFQSNGKSLHNIQVDPSNTNNIHAVIVSALDPSDADTGSTAGAVPSRRCFYTFSSDAGKTWKAPVVFSDTKTGYPDMRLMHRSDGKWIPVIAAHKVFAKDGVNPDSVKIGLWIEKGNPGDGNFSQNMAIRRNAYPKKPGFRDTVSDIIWPAIAFSPDYTTVYVAGTISPKLTTTPDTAGIQFGSFTLQEGGSATFNGWFALPGSGDPTYDTAGATIGGEYRIAVAPSGKIGLFWKNIRDNSQKPDGGAQALYFAESYDGGKTWTKPLAPLVHAGGQVDPNFPARTLWLQQSMEFWFKGEDPMFAYTAVEDSITPNGGLSYFPATFAMYLLDSAAGNGPQPIIGNTRLNPTSAPHTLDFYLPFGGLTTYENEQLGAGEVALMSFLTVGRTSDQNRFAIFFQGYANGDSEVVYDDPGGAFNGNDSILSYPYGSLYYIETTDGGQNWTDVIHYKTNDDVISTGSGQSYDYRAPQVSDFNPIVNGSAVYNTLFTVDTAAGNMWRWGIFGFDTLYYGYSTTASTNAVHSLPPTVLTFAQNNPNPFTASTTIHFSLDATTNVVLTVEDVLGRPIATLANGKFGPGEHEATFNAAGLPDGVYRYTLQAEGQSVSKCMSLIR